MADPAAVSLTYAIGQGGNVSSTRVASVGEMMYPRLAVDRDPASPFNGTLYVVGLSNLSCASIVLASSRDGGRTFGPIVLSDLCLEGPYADIAVGRNGTLFAVTKGPVVLRSLDGGTSWVTVASLNGTVPASIGSIAADPAADTVLVAWTSGDDPWSPAPGPVFVASSRDGGRSWSSGVDVLEGASSGSRPQVALSGSSAVVAYMANGPAGRYVAAVASSDGGRTWGTSVTVGPPKTCPGSNPDFPEPSIASSSDGSFGVTWSAATGCSPAWGDVEAWASVSRDGGQTFRTPVKAGGPPGWDGATFGDQIAFDDALRMMVTWHTVAPNWTSATIYVASSQNLGVTFENGSFTTRLQVSGGNSTAEESLAVGPGGIVFLAWERFDPSVNRTDPSVGIFVTPVLGEVHGNVLENGRPAASGVDVEFRDNASGAVLARRAWTGTPMDVPNLPPGAYTVWVLSGNTSTRAGVLPVKPWGRTTFTVTLGEGGVGGGLPLALIAGLGVSAAVLVTLSAVLLLRRRRGLPPLNPPLRP